MPSIATPNYLAGYPADVVAQIEFLIDNGELGRLLRKKYPETHGVRTDSALYDYVQTLKAENMRSSVPLGKAVFDGKLQVVSQALGTHTRIARVQGGKLKAKREIRIASVFRALPEAFLKMIVVHELAHLKIADHDKDFYKLCCYMEPDYFQLEFDTRVSLLWLERGGSSPWAQT